VLTLELSKTEGIVKKLIHSLGKDLLLSYTFEDIVQETYQLLLHEHHRYDESRGKWTTFVRAVTTTCLSRLRAQSNKGPQLVLCSFSHAEDEGVDWVERLVAPTPRCPFLSYDLAVAISRLPENSQKVVQAFMDRQRQETTAEQLGLSRSRIAQLQKQAFKQMREELS